MHLLGLDNYFGTATQTIHTAAGFVALSSLGVALLALTRRRPPAVPEPTLAEHSNDAPVVASAADSNAVFEPLKSAAAACAEPTQAIVPPESKTPHVLLMCEPDVEPDEATSPHTRILVTASGVTDRGKKRSINEDSLLMLDDHGVFAVADGMGGYNGGEVASALAVNTIRETFEHNSFSSELQSNLPLPRRSRELACSLLEANRAVLALAREKPELSEMGTTLVAARFSPNKQRVYVGNVGDSRCYRFRDGKLAQLTTDHTMRSLGETGPTKNQLYRAIGVKPSVDIDIIVDVPEADDVYLLCSDGLPKMVRSHEIEAILAGESDLDLAAHRLIEFANAAGGRDNVTVVLVRVQDRVARVEGPVDLTGKRTRSEARSLASEQALHAPELTPS